MADAIASRLRMALSSWLSSQSEVQRSLPAIISSTVEGPSVRRSRSSIEDKNALASTGFGSSGWRRAKASRRWVSAAARSAEADAMRE